MKLSELHYVELLYETRQSIAAKDVNLVYYLQEIERRLSAGEEAVKKVAELENDKRELVEALDTILQICHDYPLSCRARVIEKAENTIAKHKEAL